MLVSRLALMVTTAGIMITLMVLQVHPFLAGALTLLIVMTGYILISLGRSKKRLNLLEENCDPEAFLERTEKQRGITGKKPLYHAYFDIDKAAGLITLGRFEEAKEILLSVDQKLLSRKNDTLLVYTLNLMHCYYELGDIEQAEALFETQLPSLPPMNPRIVTAVEVLVAERLFHLGRYAESKTQFEKIPNQKISKRTRLGIVYGLASIHEAMGNLEEALKGYKTVASEGNKLWIAHLASEKCVFLSQHSQPTEKMQI